MSLIIYILVVLLFVLVLNVLLLHMEKITKSEYMYSANRAHIPYKNLHIILDSCFAVFENIQSGQSFDKRIHKNKIKISYTEY